jgi:replicative DNA helicase
MDVERALLSKALQSGDLADVVARGIEPDHFADEDMSIVFEWSVEFMAQHKSPPSLPVVRGEFAGFKPVLTDIPVSYLIQRFVNKVKERVAVELVRGYHDALGDPDAIEEIELYALEMANELAMLVPTPKAQRLSEGKARKHEYDRRKKKKIKPGIMIGIPSFDTVTLGIQPHELVIWGGPPGGGKTTGLQYTALNAYLQGETVLFVSLEVEGEQILRKFDTMLSHVRYRALKALELNEGEEKEWYRVLRQCEKDRAHRDIIIIDDIRNCTVEKVAAEQIRHKPGMVCVDYLEEMRTPRNVQGWEGVAANGRGLKQQARVSKVPHATATQLNREGETAYQSAQKIADMLIILMPPEDDDDDQTKMHLLMRKYRDGPSRKPATMHWDLDTMDIKEIEHDQFKPRQPLGDKTKNKLAEKKKVWNEKHRNGHGS